MNNISALLHVLSAAILIGMYIPELLIKKVYSARSDSSESKLALATVHVKMMVWFFPVLIFAVLLGVGRTFELQYPWFNFDLTLWLALKQIIGILMVIGYAAMLAPILKVSKQLSAGTGSPDDRLSAYESIRGKAHPFIMLAWVMAIFALLKF